MKLKLIIYAFLASLCMLLPVGNALAAANCPNQGSTNPSTAAIQQGVNQGGAIAQDQCATSTIDNTIANVINVLSVIVGVIAVIMIIVGGLRFITSSGNQETIKSAKNTILYALIGLVVVVLGQLIVQFVLKKTTETAKTSVMMVSQLW